MRTKQHKMNTKSASKVHQPALFRPRAEHKIARKTRINAVFMRVFDLAGAEGLEPSARGFGGVEHLFDLFRFAQCLSHFWLFPLP